MTKRQTDRQTEELKAALLSVAGSFLLEVDLAAEESSVEVMTEFIWLMNMALCVLMHANSIKTALTGDSVGACARFAGTTRVREGRLGLP